MKPTIEEIDNAKQVLINADYISVNNLFSKFDIYFRCGKLGFNFPNHDQVNNIIASIENDFDCNIGVNWNTIDKAIFNVLNN